MQSPPAFYLCRGEVKAISAYPHDATIVWTLQKWHQLVKLAESQSIHTGYSISEWHLLA